MDTVQMTLRGVPVEVADTLRAQAKAAGQSLNRYMIDKLSGDAQRFLNQQALAEKYDRPSANRVEFEEAKRLLDAMKDDWE